MKRLSLSPLRSSYQILQILEMLTRWVSWRFGNSVERSQRAGRRTADRCPDALAFLAWTVKGIKTLKQGLLLSSVLFTATTQRSWSQNVDALPKGSNVHHNSDGRGDLSVHDGTAVTAVQQPRRYRSAATSTTVITAATVVRSPVEAGSPTPDNCTGLYGSAARRGRGPPVAAGPPDCQPPMARRSAVGGRRWSKRRSPLMLQEPDECTSAQAALQPVQPRRRLDDDDAFHD